MKASIFLTDGIGVTIANAEVLGPLMGGDAVIIRCCFQQSKSSYRLRSGLFHAVCLIRNYAKT